MENVLFNCESRTFCDIFRIISKMQRMFGLIIHDNFLINIVEKKIVGRNAGETSSGKKLRRMLR